MMFRSPWFTLLLLFAVAIAIGLAGARLSRSVESVRLERGHEPLRNFESAFQQELDRLEALYEQHLLKIARETPAGNDPRAVRDASIWLVGLRQYSMLQWSGSRESRGDFHAPVDARVGEILPEPVFEENWADNPALGLPRKRIKLSAAAVLNGPSDHGWIEQPGQPPLFWARRDATHAVVLLVNPIAVRDALTGWIVQWGRREFAPVTVAGGPDALLAPNDAMLLAAGAPAGRPNLLLPLRTRFGTWHLASWDRVGVRETYHAPTMFGAAAAAVAVALLAVLVFVQQRSALRLAAQRVSFVNSVSHELRTPLTNMLLNLDLVSEHTGAGGVQRLALVREEAGRLGRLIENVLTFSRGEQGRLALRATACQPAAVLEAVLEQFSAAFARRGITMRRELEPGTCALDADALAQIAANLLSNVEKYAPGSEVALSSALEGGSLVVRVADTGPGIPAHAAERIFRPFVRLGSRLTEGVTGTGLGLAIARELAACMGGTLRLVPSEVGAIFELRVPAGEVRAPRVEVA
jgi:signal transduction histidine kinase